tara:strand:- start:38 stop:1369 length:1332 start_codon:yes stop_codon:yes gene_type:complete
MGRKINDILIGLALFLVSLSLNGQDKLSLNDCIEIAIEKNTSIKNSSLDLLTSVENKKIAIGNFLPNLNITGNHSWNTGLNQNITTGILENQTTENSSVNMSVNINLFNGLANLRTIQRANLDLMAKKYQLEHMKEDISLIVANSYLQILFNKEQLEVQNSQVKISNEELNIANEKFKNGIIPEGDLFEIEANLAIDEQNLIIAKNSYELSKIALAQLLMHSDLDNFQIDETDFDIPSLEILNQTGEEIFNVSLQKRNDIKLAETNLAIAHKEQEISESYLLPSATAYYSYNSRVIMNGTSSIKSQFDLNAGNSVGLQLNIPLLNGWSSRSNISKSKINVLRSEYLLQQTKLDLENAIYQALNDAKGARKSYEAAKKSEISRKTAYQYAKDKFESGALNTISYFQSKQLYETAQSELIKAKYDYIFKIKVLEFYFGFQNFSLR